jgi:hypothetical protein
VRYELNSYILFGTHLVFNGLSTTPKIRFLSSTLDGDVWLASRTGSFTLVERTPGTHWMKPGDPRYCLDAVVKRKKFCPWRETNHDTSVMIAEREKKKKVCIPSKNVYKVSPYFIKTYCFSITKMNLLMFFRK